MESMYTAKEILWRESALQALNHSLLARWGGDEILHEAKKVIYKKSASLFWFNNHSDMKITVMFYKVIRALLPPAKDKESIAKCLIFRPSCTFFYNKEKNLTGFIIIFEPRPSITPMRSYGILHRHQKRREVERHKCPFYHLLTGGAGMGKSTISLIQYGSTANYIHQFV